MSAFRRFLDECEPLAHLLRDLQPTKRVGAAAWLVFAAEGALLDRKIVLDLPVRGTAAYLISRFGRSQGTTMRQGRRRPEARSDGCKRPERRSSDV